MAYTDFTWTPVLVDENDMNTNVRDNFRFFYAGVGFTATKSAQSVAGAGAFVKIQGNTEVWDSHGYYDNATNFRFTPLIAGKYLVTASAIGTNISGSCHCAIFKNGAQYAYQTSELAAGQNAGFSVTDTISFNGSTDYVEMHVAHNSGANRNYDTSFSAVRIGT
jgi:hypothetical protein